MAAHGNGDRPQTRYVRSAIELRSTKKLDSGVALHSQTLNFHYPIVRRDVTDGGRSGSARRSSLRAVYQINRKYDGENFKWMDTTR